MDGKKIRVQLYIQSAFVINSEQKKEQERNSLRRIDDFIIFKDNIVSRYDEYGIYYIGIRDFLLKDNIFEA